MVAMFESLFGKKIITIIWISKTYQIVILSHLFWNHYLEYKVSSDGIPINCHSNSLSVD